MNALEQVTYHAVTRYVQRVLHIRVEDGADAVATANAHARAAGLSVDEIKRRIWHPAVAITARMGGEFAYTSEFRAALSPQGHVLTILERIPRSTSKAKLRHSRAEARRTIQQFNRRDKKRKSWAP